MTKKSDHWKDLRKRARRELISLIGDVPGPRGGRKAPYKATEAKLRLFLSHLEQHGVIMRACRQAGIHRSCVYEYRAASADFARKMRTAMAMGRRCLEDVAADRAIFGQETWQETYDADGNLTGVTITTKSDNRLLLEVLKAHRPGKWAPQIRSSDQVESRSTEEGADELRVAGRDIEEIRTKITKAIKALSSDLAEGSESNGAARRER